jgi:ERCC4-type nuclease
VLLIDDRAGSKDLKPHLDRLKVPCELTRLEYGDVMFLGRGPGDDWVKVGVEYKSLPDVLSCITTGRFAGHQLPGMLRRDIASREYDVTWLLVQGIWRVDTNSGVIQVPRRSNGTTTWVSMTVGGRGYMGRDLEGFLLTITQQSGIRIAKVGSEGEAASWLSTLYGWWTNKTWDQHKSLQTFDLSGPMVQIDKPTFTRRIAKELPGIGWKKSEAVVEHFGCFRAMAEADEKEWAEVPGIGKVLAGRIVAALHGAGTGDDA